MQVINSVSYFGRKVFVGIDVHRQTYSLSCLCDGRLVKRRSADWDISRGREIVASAEF